MLKKLRSLNLTAWILIALVIGIVIGVCFPDFAHLIKPLRTLFLNAVKCIVAPLIFSSIICGINSSGDLKSLGRTGFRALIWFEIASFAALAIGLLFVNWFQPGHGMSLGAKATADLVQDAQVHVTFQSFIEHLLPTNFVEAVGHGEVLQVVLLSVVFGIALLITGEGAKPILILCESLNAVMFRVTEIVMYMAPMGVGAAIAGSIAEHGLGVLLPMGKMLLTLYVALAVFIFAVLVPALRFSKIRPLAFLKELRPSLTLAFATTSSESAYPGALHSLHKIGVPDRVASFVLPLGYSFNLDGSTLYLAVASVFIAQAAQVPMSIGQQLSMMIMLMVTSKGVAAVPRASIVVLSATLTAFHLPLEGVVLILGVDEFMDMARTSVNLLGNCVATVLLSHLEGDKLKPEFQVHD